MNKKFLTALASLFIVASSVLALNGFSGTSSAAVDNTPDCDTVAIIKCGAFSESDLRAAAAKGDVPKVFSAFGISQSELTGFVSGVVWQDGRVTVGDKLVATGATTAGRWNNPKPGMTRIPGTDRAYKMSTSHFVTEGQTAFIKMVNGQFSFAVIKSCGNPVSAKPTPKPPVPQPTYACESLRKTQASRTEFRFDATASAANGAKITKYTFNYGDGTTRDVPTNGSKTAAASHTYTKPGTYTARVTVFVLVNGKTVQAPGTKCAVSITVTPPPATPAYACDSLTANLIGDEKDRTYKYTLDYTAEGGAVLRDVDFNFGDGSVQNGLKPANLDDIRHTYAKEGSYTTTATLHFTVAGKVQDKKCVVKINVSPDACPHNPSLPKDSPDCERCPIPGKEQYPKNSDECKDTPTETPQVLPDTGPAELAAGGLGLGSLAGAGYYWRASRRNLIDKLLNR